MFEEFVGMPILKQIFSGAFALSFAGGALCWLVGAIYLIRIPFNTVSGASPKFFSLRAWFRPDSFRDWMMLNPINAIFYSELLTPKGRVLRKRLFFCLGGFLAFWLLGMMTGLIAQHYSSP